MEYVLPYFKRNMANKDRVAAYRAHYGHKAAKDITDGKIIATINSSKKQYREFINGTGRVHK